MDTSFFNKKQKNDCGLKFVLKKNYLKSTEFETEDVYRSVLSITEWIVFCLYLLPKRHIVFDLQSVRHSAFSLTLNWNM